MKDSGGAEVLVLAGDVAVGPVQVQYMLDQFARIYPVVMYLPGNHEFYSHNINCMDTLDVPANVFVLNPGLGRVGDITFIGAPLWTNFRNDAFAMHAANNMISDFTRIRHFTPVKAKALFEKHWEFIKFHYDSIPGKKVIITHFLPAVECISERYRGGTLINNYFANDLGEDIKDMKDVAAWMFGHTHDSLDFMLGDVRMLCNPMGYLGHEINPQFKYDVIYEV
jgi:hypothetical protein